MVIYSQQQSIKRLTAQAQTESRTTALKLQAQCAKQAKVFFDANVWRPYQHPSKFDQLDTPLRDLPE
jgi:hypothetical protein